MKYLEDVFIEHQRNLFAAALAITRNRAMAEDCVHEALLAIAGLRQKPNDIAAYLYRVVRNKALHGLKQASRHQELEEDYLEPVTDASQAALMQQIKQHIGTLGQDEQQVLILKLFEDMTFEEIARILEASPNTVASWYRRGLGKLKEMLDE